MAEPDLAAAWDAIHENTPDGWYVGKPVYEERYRQSSMYAFDPSEKAVNGGQEMARCLGALKAGRWPK